ncbi:hypothetical protein R1flu_001431 [Riccia fluitans]|uniref:Uncharacterized protein n=1 Tax=Riccia fluitans TaxID=41844 RepID=A0ABD1Y3L5_9MARC
MLQLMDSSSSSGRRIPQQLQQTMQLPPGMERTGTSEHDSADVYVPDPIPVPTDTVHDSIDINLLGEEAITDEDDAEGAPREDPDIFFARFLAIPHEEGVRSSEPSRPGFSVDPKEIMFLGTRDIIVVWRGTRTDVEWQQDAIFTS